MLRKSFAAIAAVALLAGSSAAVAQSAQSLSVGNAPAARSSAALADPSELGGRRGIGIYLIGAAVLGLLIWGIIQLTKSDEGPESP